MKDYNWIEYEKIYTVRGARENQALTITVTKNSSKTKRLQIVLKIPEHICKASNIFIGERINFRWTEDKKIASIYKCKDGYRVSLQGGMKKGDTAKSFGSFKNASVKVALTETLRSVFFANSLNAYCPEIVSISNGEIVLKI